MRFAKLESLGNDFILIEGDARPRDFGALVRAICDRKRGVGGDGVLLVLPGDADADTGMDARVAARVEIWNADGSEAAISGNGTRCAARWLASHRAAANRPDNADAVDVVVSMRAKCLSVSVPRSLDGGIRVPLGEPRFEPASVPMRADGERFVEAKLDGVPLAITALSVGNPHAVLFVDGPVAASRLGPVIESHPAFPERTNVEFVRVAAPDRLIVVIWERGVGPTASSGTGAAAAFAAAVVTGRASRRATVEMEGGSVAVGWDESGVWTEAPAREVFAGEWPS